MELETSIAGWNLYGLDVLSVYWEFNLRLIHIYRSTFE